MMKEKGANLWKYYLAGDGCLFTVAGYKVRGFVYGDRLQASTERDGRCSVVHEDEDEHEELGLLSISIFYFLNLMSRRHRGRLTWMPLCIHVILNVNVYI